MSGAEAETFRLDCEQRRKISSDKMAEKIMKPFWVEEKN